ncbi:MAG: hypothetical protein ACFE9O_12305, partial [Promethearchaeota archaeon]
MAKSTQATKKMIDSKLVTLRKREKIPPLVLDGLRERLLEQKINTKQLSTIIKEVEAAYDN